jgi:hypothetical protein
MDDIRQLLQQKIINQTMRLSPVLSKYFSNFFTGQLQNPVFIIGCARSGTTLLANVLGMHRDVANWSEANQIWDQDWYPWRPTNQGKWPLEFDPVAFTTRWWHETELRQRQIKATFGAYQWLWHKPYFLNKSPFNTFRIPYLLKMFPEARFIHIIRDGRAVAYSHARKLRDENKLQEWPEPQQTTFANSFDVLVVWLASFWKASVEEVSQQDKVLGLSEAGILLELTYEELCADTSTTLSRICQYIGLDATRFAPEVRKKQIQNQNHKYQQSLSTDLLERMASVMQPLLRQKGYV